MAATKRRRRKATTHARRRSSARATTHRARRRYRRNPPSFLKAIPAFALSAGIGALSATGGKVAARKGRALLKIAPGSVFGMAAEGLIGLAVGMAVAQVHPGIGRDIALGGLQAPIESTLSRLKLPFVSDALGADDYYLGFSDAVDTMNGGQLAGYVDGPTGGRYAALGDVGEMGDMGASESGARYVAGPMAA